MRRDSKTRVEDVERDRSRVWKFEIVPVPEARIIRSGHNTAVDVWRVGQGIGQPDTDILHGLHYYFSLDCISACLLASLADTDTRVLYICVKRSRQMNNSDGTVNCYFAPTDFGSCLQPGYSVSELARFFMVKVRKFLIERSYTILSTCEKVC